MPSHNNYLWTTSLTKCIDVGVLISLVLSYINIQNCAPNTISAISTTTTVDHMNLQNENDCNHIWNKTLRKSVLILGVFSIFVNAIFSTLFQIRLMGGFNKMMHWKNNCKL